MLGTGLLQGCSQQQLEIQALHVDLGTFSMHQVCVSKNVSRHSLTVDPPILLSIAHVGYIGSVGYSSAVLGS